MTAAILTVALLQEGDIIAARQRARQIAGLLGFEAQDQTRIATAVSEIARNAATYGGGGRVSFSVESGEAASFLVHVRDTGPGIADVEAVLEGRFKSVGGLGMGVAGARRLMDRFELESRPGAGVQVVLGKRLPQGGRAVTSSRLAALGKALAATGAADPLAEARTQNQELMQALADLGARQAEAERLNLELENTNRGVLALYAELDEKASELSRLNGDLEARIAAAVLDRQAANDALRQSQKMEAIGQLTGGVAHDFNNLLQVVTGNLEVLLRRLPADDPRLQRAAVNAMSGAQRAATLTQRLLAFARRQPLAPKPLLPNALVEGMSDLMHRALGEPVDIKLNLADDLWRVEADANQLENALLNLAVNARDAMSGGGVLTISTANAVVAETDAAEDAAPGQYVSLAVCDTGAGMSEATLSRVLEPFFTTKEVGKGTGLGLSMAYGFARQSGGHLRIESSLGRGTTVTIYLPRYTGEGLAEASPECRDCPAAVAGETVLVVEDDADVRSHTCEVLAELGYGVRAVSDGPAALEVLAERSRLDLLFTDVVLAGPMNGRDVADEARRLRPLLPVLFTSGYARDAIVAQGRLAEGVQLLAKPFSMPMLARRLRELLDRTRPASDTMQASE